MHALIINGSPRRVGSTGVLCEHFAKGVAHSGGSSSIVCLGDEGLAFCRGCCVCDDTLECAIDDGMRDLVSQMIACDILVLASPSYWGDVTAQMKTFIDRSRPLGEHVRGGYVGRGKAGASIAVRAGGAEEENLHLIQCFEHYFGHLGIKPAGRLTVEGVQTLEDLTAEHMERAFRLGETLGGVAAC